MDYTDQLTNHTNIKRAYHAYTTSITLHLDRGPAPRVDIYPLLHIIDHNSSSVRVVWLLSYSHCNTVLLVHRCYRSLILRRKTLSDSVPLKS